jgi:hypothetical protein
MVVEKIAMEVDIIKLWVGKGNPQIISQYFYKLKKRKINILGPLNSIIFS